MCAVFTNDEVRSEALLFPLSFSLHPAECSCLLPIGSQFIFHVSDVDFIYTGMFFWMQRHCPI